MAELKIDMSFDDYRKLKRMNASGLKKMHISPAHYRASLLVSEEPTDAMKLGTLVHSAILEPEKFHTQYVVVPETMPKRPTSAQLKAKNPSDESRKAMDIWAAFEANNQGKEVITQKDYDLAMSCANSAHGNKWVRGLMKSGNAEATLLFNQEDVECKARFDWLCTTRALILDVKTTENASEFSFTKDIFGKYMYGMQAAFYADAMTEHTGIDHDFIFLAVEKKAPYAIGLYHMNQDALNWGREIYKNLLDKYRICRDSNDWEDFGSEIKTVSLPNYLKQNEPSLELY